MSTPSANNPIPSRITSPQRRPTLEDRMALWVVKLAKLRRSPLNQLEDDYDAFYEQFFEEKDLEAYDKDQRMVVRGRTIIDALLRYKPAPARLLDVGCGLGDVLARLPDQYQLVGTDYAWNNVRISGRRLAGRASIARASIYELPYESNSFDACLCLEVLEHIEDDQRAAREIARVMKPGGILIAAVPYTYYWPQYLRLMGHFRHYTRESFSALMNDAGLAVQAHLPNYPRWHQAYTRRYAMIRAKAMTFGRLLGRSSLYTFRWPWHSRPALTRLAERLEPMRKGDAALDYSILATSTFLLARKPGEVRSG